MQVLGDFLQRTKEKQTSRKAWSSSNDIGSMQSKLRCKLEQPRESGTLHRQPGCLLVDSWLHLGCRLVARSVAFGLLGCLQVAGCFLVAWTLFRTFLTRSNSSVARLLGCLLSVARLLAFGCSAACFRLLGRLLSVARSDVRLLGRLLGCSVARLLGCSTSVARLLGFGCSVACTVAVPW